MSGLIASLALAVALLVGLTPEPSGAQPSKPNVIVVMADDLDTHTVDILPRLRSLLHERGTEFTNMIAADPVCCPDRASFLRGQYVHNHGLTSAGRYRAWASAGNEDSTLATWMQAAGYRTALVGKYFAQYRSREAGPTSPPGWDFWRAHWKGRYFDYSISDGTSLIQRGREPEDYSTDVLASHAEEEIERAAGLGKPLFLVVGPKAPHNPDVPAARHRDAAVPEDRVPRTGDFNEDDASDKPAYLRDRPKLTEAEIARVDERHRNRQRMMLSVEDLLARLYEAIDRAGQADRTYLIFTSDNGFKLGHQRADFGKNAPYETDIRLPLVVIGPGIAAGRQRPELVSMIDLAPTVADLGVAEVPEFADGRSIVPLMRGETPTWRKAIFAQGFGRAGVPPWTAVRTATHVFIEYDRTGEEELYDLRADPRQLDNLLRPGSQSAQADNYRRTLDRLRTCAAASCRSAEDDG